MVRVSLSSSGGILVEYSGRKYVLDPKKSEPADYIFVSHAHSDHVHRPARNEKIIATEQTVELASLRGYDLQTEDEPEDVKLLDSGHILGSRSILIDDCVLYTGDLAGRERGFMQSARVKNARILIIESTYGSPEYLFPPVSRTIREVNSLISMCFDRGQSVVLMGYTLGKAQVISHLFASWKPFVHESVEEVNMIYRKHGLAVPKLEKVSSQEVEKMPKGPWVLVAPIMSSRSSTMRFLKKKYNAVSIAFSGWAVNNEYKRRIGADFAFALSDHCDFNELVSIVQRVSPEVVYTTHGFSSSFSRELKKLGFDSRALSSYQSELKEYINE